MPRWVTVLAIGLIAVAAALRLVASWDDFWLDEIWSWHFAVAAKSYWQIATQMPHDNNQILNTWAIYTFPKDAHWTFYRIPAVFAGIGAVIFAGLGGWKRSRVEGLTALLLTGTSFVFIQYSSEARGYAYLLLFIYLSVWLMQRIDQFQLRRDEWLFGLSVSFGVLAHFLFVAAYAGLILWSVISVMKRYRVWSTRYSCWCRMHAFPFLTLATLALCYGRKPITGGGDPQKILEIISQVGSLIVGGPNYGPFAVVCCCLTSVASIAGLVLLIRKGEGVAYFVIGSTITLALLIVIASTDLVYPRHFLVPLACVLILLSHLLATAWSSNRMGKVVYIVVVGLMLAGNTLHTQLLLQYGRGSYEDAVAYLVAESKETITYSSDHEFRNRAVFDYYYLRLPRPRPFEYYPADQWPSAGPEWVILHSFQYPAQAEPEFSAGGHRYQLAKVFPYYGLSGWNWIIYRRVPEGDRMSPKK